MPDIEPVVSFEARVTSGISREVLAAFQGLPPGGNEAGGILLGKASGEIILVEDFEPVLCQHRFGPSYILSESDLRALEESLDWFRSQPDGLRVLGFYRSQVCSDQETGERDNSLMLRFFRTPGSLFLLLKPCRGDRITAELFVLGETGLRAAGHPMVFPSDIWAPAPPAPPVAEPAASELSPPRDRDMEPGRFPPPELQEPPPRNWTWVAVVVALTLGAAILGFLTVAPKSSGAPQQAVSKARPPSQTPMTAREPASLPAEPDSPEPAAAPAPSTEQAVRQAIDHWVRAIRSGEAKQIAQCYAPFVDRYLDQRNFSNEQIAHAAEESMTRYGKPAIFRVSELSLIPVSDSRAIASFRRHWQTSGAKPYAGEEQERLIFVKYGESWKVASEELVKTYWTQPPTN